MATATELQSIREEVEIAAAPTPAPVVSVGEKATAETISIPSIIETVDQLETLIKSLEAHRYGIGAGKALNLSIEP